MRLRAALLIVCTSLTGCVTSTDQLSFDACSASVLAATAKNRTYSDAQKRSFEIDSAATLATITPIEDSVFELRVIASVDGEGGQRTPQNFLCRTRFTPGQDSPDVIAFHFLLDSD
jgi:hypothetical protein